MHIARILTRLNLGGPARQVLASDPRLIERGLRVTVYAGEPEPGEGDLRDVLRSRGVRVVDVPTLARPLHLRQDWRAQRFLREQFLEERPDLVHTHTSKAGWLGRRVAQGMGIPSVHTFHGHVLMGHYGRAKARGIATLERRMARRTQALLAVSQATARELVAFGVTTRDRLRVVYAGSELEPLVSAAEPQRRRPVRLAEVLDLPREALCIGVLGRLAPIKNPVGALRAFRAAWPALQAATPRPVHLIFIGDGPERAALERERECMPPAAKANVHLAGAWGNMVDVLPALDLVLSASRHEGLPIALIEAGAVGAPAVATPVGGVPEFVQPGRTGWLGADTGALAEGLRWMVEDEERRTRLGQRARELALSRHSAEALTQRLIDVYLDVRGGRP